MFKRVFNITMICVFLLFNCNVMAADFSDNRVVDKHKNWTIHFNDEIDFDEISSEDICVITSKGYTVDYKITPGENNKSVIVHSPSEGYKPGENYILSIKNTVHSKENQYLERSIRMNFSIESNNDVMDKLIVLPDTDYDEYEAEQMIKRLSKIDHRILEELADKNVKIKLTNTNVTDVDEYTYLKGVTPRGWEGTGKTWDDIPGAGGNPVVARIGCSTPSYGHGHGAVNLELHETAHAIDRYVFDGISGKEKFCSIMNIEGDKLFPNNGYTAKYPEEYFAETFAMYYLGNQKDLELKEKAPLTYKFMEELSKKISEEESLKNAG